MSWRAQVVGSLLIAAVLVVVAAGLARPVGQRCAEAESLADHQLRDEAISAYQALLKSTAPTCAAVGLQRELALGVTTTVATSQVPTTTSPLTATTVSGMTAVTTVTRPPAPPSPVKSLDHNLPRQLSGISDLREWVADLGLTLIGWILIGLAALVVFRAAWTAIASGKAASIDIGSVTAAGSSPSGSAATQAGDPAVMAQLKDRLAGRQLFGSTAVLPTGTPGNVGGNELAAALATAIKAADSPASGVAALLSFLPNLIPRAGLTIDAVMRVGEMDPRSGCTITLTDQSKGKVVAIHTHWDQTPLLAVDGAVLSAIAYIGDLPRFCRRTAVWSRFGAQEDGALIDFVRGEDCERAGEVEKALAAYKEALAGDPGNLTIAMKVANTHELLAATPAPPAPPAQPDAPQPVLSPSEHLTKAIDGYRRATRLWPDALAARYRLALALGESARSGTDAQAAAVIIAEAQGILVALRKDLRFQAVLGKWARTFVVPRYRRDGTRSYFEVLLARGRRARLRAAFGIAEFVVSQSDDDTTVRRLLAPGVGRPSPDWQMRYNAACYYARRAERRGRAEDHDGAERDYVEANDLIAQVLRDPDSQLTGTWLESDPDLAGLQNWAGATGQANVIPAALFATATA